MASTPAFLALKADDNWVPTGYLDLGMIQKEMVEALGGKATMINPNWKPDPNEEGYRIRLVDTDLPAEPNTTLQSHHFAPVRSFQCKLERPYDSTASCAGSSPGVSGRVDWSDFMVERNCDAASPIIFENCCTGAGFDKAMLCYWIDDPDFLHKEKLVLIEFCSPNISSYEIIGDRWSGERQTTKVELANSKVVTKKSFIIDGIRKEKVTFWHTQMSVTFRDVLRGWDAGTETSYPPPWPRGSDFNWPT